MENTPITRKIHPLVAGAAVSVILVSLIGVAAITGILPGAHGQNQQQTGLIDSTGQVHDANTPTGVALPSSNGAPGNATANTAAPATAQGVGGTPPVNAAVPPPNTPAPAEQAPAVPCHSCGVVEAVRPVQHQAQTSGVGAVAGAIIGGVIGNRFGGGNGRALSTAAGAVGGGFAGNEIEKHGKSTVSYQVTVKMESGKLRTFSFGSQPVWNVGDRVQVVNGALSSRA